METKAVDEYRDRERKSRQLMNTGIYEGNKGS
jgi:hypothetical protein